MKAQRIICPKCDGIGTVGGGRLDWDVCPRCKGEGEIEASRAVRFDDGSARDWP